VLKTTGMFRSFFNRWVADLALVVFIAAAGPCYACTVSGDLSSPLGVYSPAAVKAGVVPALRSRAGLSCPSGVLFLLSNNFVKAKFHSQNGFKLKQSSGTSSIVYSASADPGGATPFAEGASVDYMQNNLLNLLGLLGSSSADLPFYVKPSGVTPQPGVYTDKVTVDWTWSICPGIGLLGLCIGIPDAGTGSAVITVTLVVSPQSVVMTMASVTTWDPLNGTVAPKAIPGSRRRLSLSLTNPDIVPLDAGAIAIVLPTPAGAMLALDGDGASNVTPFKLIDGSSPSGATLRYGAPADMTDDIDFSADGGQTWTYAPVAGDLPSQAAVTHVRIRPQGDVAKQSSLSVSAPFLVR